MFAIKYLTRIIEALKKFETKFFVSGLLSKRSNLFKLETLRTSVKSFNISLLLIFDLFSNIRFKINRHISFLILTGNLYPFYRYNFIYSFEVTSEFLIYLTCNNNSIIKAEYGDHTEIIS